MKSITLMIPDNSYSLKSNAHSSVNHITNSSLVTGKLHVSISYISRKARAMAQPNIQAFYKPLLTVFTDSAAFRVEHAAVTLCMSTGVNQAPLLPFVKGHVTQGTAVRHLLLHAQVTQDVNVWKKQRQRLKFSVSGGTSSSMKSQLWLVSLFFVLSRSKLFLVQSSKVKVCNTEQAEKIQTKQKQSNSSQFFFIHIAFLHFSTGIHVP